ncbi:MAG: ATP-binding protein [Leptospirillia bacterium]
MLTTDIRDLFKLNAEMRDMNYQLKSMQEQLLQSEKLASVGQLAAGVAHEINNPVGYISSNLSSLERYVDQLFQLIKAHECAEALIDPDGLSLSAVAELKGAVDYEFLESDTRDLIKESLEGASRVKKIILDLKTFAHSGEGQLEWADLHKGLESTLNICNNELKYKAEVICEFGELPELRCIPSQLNQVFMNLLVNAAQAIDTQGVVTVRTGTEKDEVWVEVQDTGKGISPEHLDRLFDPFFTTKPVGEGTGLGLSLSYGIVNKHGGHIEVQSEVGKGSTFRVCLPLHAPPQTDNVLQTDNVPQTDIPGA